MMFSNLPPGPRGHLLTGNLLDFKDDPIGFLERCAREYGDVVRLRFITRPVYLLSHPDHVAKVLATNQRSFAITRAPKDAGGLFGNAVFTSSGPDWLRQRRRAQPAFNHCKVRSYAALMVSLTNEWIGSWRDNETKNLHQEMVHLTLGIVARLFFGVDITDQLDDFAAALDLVREHYWLWWTRLSALVPAAVPTPANRSLRNARRKLDEVVYEIIRHHSRDNGENLLGFLANAAGPDGAPLSQRELRDEVITFLVTGHETTAAALAWIWYLLATHPEAEQRLEAEIDSVLGERPATFEDLRALAYAKMIMLESMRLYPPGWALNRIAIKKCEIAGYEIPKGASVLMSQWVIHRDPRFFVQPERFHPERWQGDLASRLPKYAYFPFGGGQRTCIGKELAMLQILLTLVTIARKCRFRLVDNFAIALNPSIILRPATGLRVVVHDRCRYRPHVTISESGHPA